MENKELAKQLDLSSPYVLYVVNEDNRIIKKVCPFGVEVLSPVGDLNVGEYMSVDEIKVTSDLITVYKIKDKLYYYRYFNIL